jgi:dihydrofolate reductase/thymidylate synthase
MDSIGFNDREVNDLGPVYGHQWRHFNAEYKDQKTDYTDKGVDQIQQIIHLLKNDPMSRRIILTAWNPCQINQVNLPPCHMMCQFYVSSNKELSCMMYQRSADIGLGLPFNIASYAVLTYILGKLTNLKPKKLSIIIGDAHIYENHIDALKEQITREPFEFPKLELNLEKEYNKVEDFDINDFKILNYKCFEHLKMQMVP